MAELIRADEVALQPWRNGGGQTRELLAWPSSADCKVRIALADIDKDGPFSTYEGVERWIVVIAGVGIDLNFSSGDRRLLRGDDPLRFEGADAPGCRLVDGSTRDLNLMVRGGSGVMRSVRSGIAWDEKFAMRGVFAAEPGTLASGEGSVAVPSMTLYWIENAGREWTFQHDAPQSTTQAWWLGFTVAQQ